jgi:Asp-tRNA(Asn)/Glu-tRNA(Gln) amidotransferase A subunit family amidase
VARLHQAGAVLVAKLSLGALALNDIWYGGQTNNPWLLEEGASGSSAGPGAATAAGCVGFALGSETGGSIIAPSMRCGVTGLRPTFGRVPRTGAMTCAGRSEAGADGPQRRGHLLCSRAQRPDAGDVSSVPSKLEFDANAGIKGLKVGFFPRWMGEAPATDVDRAALETLKKLGAAAVEVQIPDWPYNSLSTILFAEAAAAFEELTLSHGLDQLKMQVPDAWPNIFRQSRFLSAVDMVQPTACAARSRRRWRGCSRRSTCCSFPRCATDADDHNSPPSVADSCAPAWSRSASRRRLGADPRIRCQSSQRCAASPWRDSSRRSTGHAGPRRHRAREGARRHEGAPAGLRVVLAARCTSPRQGMSRRWFG